jgi:hypothetical protein
MPHDLTQYRFKPGQSGNSAARGKQKITKLARIHSHEAVTKLVHLMRNGKKEEVQFKAATAILERAFGKAAQSVDMTVNDNREAAELSRDELAIAAARILARVGSGDTPGTDSTH